MNISKAKRALRGDVNAGTAALEALRRVRIRLGRRNERAQLSMLNRQAPRLGAEFANMSAADLLAHFRTRTSPRFLAGFADLKNTVATQRQLFADETARLVCDANAIANRHCWDVLGFGEKCFGFPEIDWNRDPLSGIVWPLDYHADINLLRRDGSDARVVWELNRLAHLITLGRAYALTNDEKFSAEFVRQIASWRTQNPVARGLNWNCAMEVALRAMNLLGAFHLFLPARDMTEDVLVQLLRIFDQHGRHIARNLEFSHIATSNHYLCDVAGLLWLGIMLPELEAARDWRDFGLREMLREMDKQILPDGADYEASTGYHRLKLELFLYSFLLCHANSIQIDEKYWEKLRRMIDYVRAYLRPDGRAPLIGDCDSGQLFPITKHAGDDHAYVLTLAAAAFQEERFKPPQTRINEELLWMLGEQGVRDFQRVRESPPPISTAFPDAGVYVLRQSDLYLHFKPGGIGVNGRGSHGHNDALSVEVSACGTAFIVDPSSYVYTADLHERHLFRSTAYHSTVEIDQVEQNFIDEAVPFIIGNEAQPRVLSWKTGAEADIIVAEHYGYRRLAQPITHRRTVKFHKTRRYWIISDEFAGEGTHNFLFRFHLATGLHVEICPDRIAEVCDNINGARLLIAALGLGTEPQLQSQYSSNDYGAKAPSVSVCWSWKTVAPIAARFVLVPMCAGEDEAERMQTMRVEMGNCQLEIGNN